MAAKTLFLPLLLLTLAAPARATWWRFAVQEGAPAVQDLVVNRFRLADLSAPLFLAPEDLEGGAATLRGRAVMQGGAVAAVEVSLDGGSSWAKAQLSRNGQFQHTFRPEPGRQYRLAVRALSTAGKAGEAQEAPYAVSLRQGDDASLSARAREVFLKMIEDYSNARVAELKRQVSDDFEGDRTALEDAIDNDLRLFRNIRIRPKISRVRRVKDDFEISFSYDRQVTSVRGGQVLRDQSSSVVTFRRDGEDFKLLSMTAPLLFGVSDTSSVSSSVSQQSMGQEVLTVTKTGEATTASQTETPAAAASNIRSGSVVLNFNLTADSTESFDFESQSKRTSVISEVQTGGTLNGHLAAMADHGGGFVKMVTNGEAAIQSLGSGALAGFATAPESGYSDASGQSGGGVRAQSGGVFALKTSGDIFVIFQVTATSVTPGPGGTHYKAASLSIEYKAQMSGTRNF